DTTHAHIDTGATVTSESAVGVSALDESTEIGITGAVTAAENVGVGISFGLNVISRDTQAFVGAGIDPSTGQPKTPGSPHTTIDADGPVTVQPVTDGALWTASVAAAVAKSDTPNAPPQRSPSDTALAKNAPTKAQQLLGIKDDPTLAPPKAQKLLGVGADPKQPTVSISVPADVAFTPLTKDNPRAFVNEAATVASDKSANVRSEAKTAIWSLAGSVAISLNASNKTSVGIAGSISVTVMNADERAFITSATVPASAAHGEAS